MSLTDRIAKIYTELFGEEITNESCKLDDGSICEYSAFEVGQDVFQVAEDGTKSPLADGTYVREDGVSFTVVAGKITEILESEPEEIEVVPEAVAEPKNEIPQPDFSQFEDRLKKIEDAIASLQDGKELSNVVDLVGKITDTINRIETRVSNMEKTPVAPLVNTKKIITPKDEETPSWIKRF